MFIDFKVIKIVSLAKRGLPKGIVAQYVNFSRSRS
jgi:hypothetical protein